MIHSAHASDHHNAPLAEGEPALPRRAAALAMAAWALGPRLARASLPEVRLGVLQFGTVQWVAEVIRGNELDAQHGFTLRTSTLANTDAGRVALMANAADIVVSDWMFVATQRAAGTPLRFAPFSNATGGLIVPAVSSIKSLADLAHRRLGVAGGPVDKSWLIVRAASQAVAGMDPADMANVAYGAPPLLNAKLQQGELDAVLTFWNFAARLEAAGYRQVISVADCARSLGMPGVLPLVGFVFREDWAYQSPVVISGFLKAAVAAEALLSSSEVAWEPIRPLMDAADAALFVRLQRAFIEGIAHPPAAAQDQAAAKLFDVLLRTGGPRATGGLEKLPQGIFWANRE